MGGRGSGSRMSASTSGSARNDIPAGSAQGAPRVGDEPALIGHDQITNDGNYYRVESRDGSWDGYELYDTYKEAVESTGGKSEVVNGNRISTDGDGGYIVASANGSWTGYEMYDSYREAREAAMMSDEDY